MASFTGSIADRLLTVSAIASGVIAAGQPLSGDDVAAGTVILAGAGDAWIVNIAQTVASAAMTTPDFIPSRKRTISVSGEAGFLPPGIIPPQIPLRWEMNGPDANLDYSLDLARALQAEGDAIEAVTVSVAPNGSGELSASNLTVTGSLITVFLGGGIAGRVYRIKVVVTTTSSPARSPEYLVYLPIDPRFAIGPIPPPQNIGFGTPLTFTG
jgi:hypothetical protein